MSFRLCGLLERLRDNPARLIFVSDEGTPTERTFADLYRDTHALIRSLKAIGTRPRSRVGILAPSSYAWMKWDLALTELGCVSVGLMPDGERNVEALSERLSLALLAASPAVVTEDALGAEYVIDCFATDIPAGKRPRCPPPVAHPAGTHSLAFSSGTSGRTKGLIISAPGTERLIDLYAEAFGAPAGERLLTFLPFSNYQQRMTYYFCLYYGIDFVYTPYQQLFASLRAQQPTFIIAPPIFYESVRNVAQSLEASASAASPATRLAALMGGKIRYLITGMAPIRRPTLEFFWSRGLALYEAFGITEAGMVAWNKPGFVKLGTVGRPAEDGSVTVAEDGEVIVSRDALLSLGYFDAPEEEIRATFVGEHSVATGDIATIDEQGYLTIAGRKKDAIVTRSGEKFHPEKIESLIQQHGGVKVAVVTAYEDIAGTTAIIALQNPSRDGDARDVREHIEQLNAQLPACQQVRKVVFTPAEFSIENGFRTRNMKLDRRAIHAAFRNA